MDPAWANVKISFDQIDQDAAWNCMLKCCSETQRLPDQDVDYQIALDSVYSPSPITREILRRRGGGTIAFRNVAIPVLNPVIRPFTAKWHRGSLGGAFNDSDKRMACREEL